MIKLSLWEYLEKSTDMCLNKIKNNQKIKLCNKNSILLSVIQNSRSKELSLCHKDKFFNPNIFATRWFKPLIFQT